MPKVLSRRSIAHYVASELLKGSSRTHLARQLVAHLIESRRTNELDVIMRDIQYHLAQQGHVTGTVTTAHALEAATKVQIEQYIKDQMNANDVQIDAVQDATVLGGVRISLPGYERDATVARQLHRLKTEYRKV